MDSKMNFPILLQKKTKIANLPFVLCWKVDLTQEQRASFLSCTKEKDMKPVLVKM